MLGELEALEGHRGIEGDVRSISPPQLAFVPEPVPRVAVSLDLTVETLSHFSTVCARKQATSMKRWRAIPNASVELYQFGDVQAVDVAGVDRVQDSQHYTKRTDYTFEVVRTTLLIDCETSAIIDIHCSMKQSHDIQVGL